MIPHLFVIDEFLPNPEAVRAKALQAELIGGDTSEAPLEEGIL